MRSALLLAGILCALWLPEEWRHLWPLALAAAMPCLLWRRTRVVVFAVLGALHAGRVADAVTTLPPVDAGTRLVVEARVDSVPARDDSGWQFDANITFPRHAGWPGQRWRVRLPASSPGPAPGETWQYALRFDPPRDARARRLLLRDRVSAQARMVDGALNVRLAAAGGGLDALRARLARDIGDRVADPSAATLLVALAVGVTGDVAPRQWQVFNATGITHLVAISGMHVTFFAMLSMAAARRLWPLCARWPGAPRRELFAATVGCTMALLYALLSGFAVPAQRTVVMLAAFLAARECQRAATPVWSMQVALAAVLLFDPLAALSAGFWLSFLAVAAIVLLAGARVAPGAPLRDAARLQWLVSVALLPATVVLFGSFSAVGLLANALAIPVFTLLLVPPVLVATAFHLLPGELSTWCAHQLVDLAAAVAAALWPFLAWCAGLPGALWRTGPPLSWYALAAPALLMALLPLGARWRAPALALLASAFLLREPRPREGELWIDVPDAGRSAAAVLRTREHLVLWGTGESYGAGGRAFARHVQPLLRASGYAALDLWLPGSLTRDVQAALALGAAQMPVQRVLVPPARPAPPESRACTDGAWRWNGIAFALRATTDGRRCELTVLAGTHLLNTGEMDVARFATGGDTVRLVLDTKGLRQRRRLLGL